VRNPSEGHENLVAVEGGGPRAWVTHPPRWIENGGTLRGTALPCLQYNDSKTGAPVATVPATAPAPALPPPGVGDGERSLPVSMPHCIA